LQPGRTGPAWAARPPADDSSGAGAGAAPLALKPAAELQQRWQAEREQAWRGARPAPARRRPAPRDQADTARDGIGGGPPGCQYDHCKWRAATPPRHRKTELQAPSRPAKPCCVSRWRKATSPMWWRAWIGHPRMRGCWPRAPEIALSSKPVAERVIGQPEGGGGGGGIDRGPGRACRIATAVGSLPLPRPHRPSARRTRQGPWRRRLFRMRKEALGGASIERIHGAQRPGPGCWAPLRLSGLLRRRPAHRGDPAPPLCRVCCSDEVETATPRCSTVAGRCSMTAASPFPGTHRGLPQHGGCG